MTGRSRAITCLLLSAVLVPGGVEGASVLLEAAQVMAYQGQPVDIPLRAIDAQGLGSLELDMVFEPGILEIQGVRPGPLMDSSGGGQVEHRMVDPGRLRLTLITSQPVRGSGDLVLVQAVTRGRWGRSSTLGLVYARAWERSNYYEMLVTIRPGTLRVVSPPPDWLAGGAAVLLLLALLWSRRRRSRTPSSRSVTPGPSGSHFCTQCGQPLAPGHQFCGSCGRAAGV